MSGCRSTRWLAGALAGALGAGAAAQENGEVGTFDPNFTAPRAYIDGEEVREPARMRLPEVRLVGMEEEGNSFRWRTPALANGQLEPKIVDADDAYARRLSMYEPSDPVGDEFVGDEAPVAVPAGEAKPIAATEPLRWQWPGVAGVLLVAAAVWRRRAMTAELAAAATRREARRRH